MEKQNQRPPLDKFRWIGIGVTIGSYFTIKYGVAAQLYGAENTNNFFYSLLLIFACIFIGRAVEGYLRSRAKGNNDGV